ncbi:MAG: helix-turn-helix transcriptional regulator, partial [Spirochaetales bacterium]|nr:helix-turn-helix transcriptional regulator [Spirochaetales bacterium]
MISYKGLEAALKAKNIGKTELSTELGLSTRTVAKIAKGEKLSKNTILRIASFLGKSPDALMQELSDNPILRTLREEKAVNLSGGLYHTLQIKMAFNSNHIEGSRLSEDQTRFIFETNTINVGDSIPVDDILETVHHFRAVDYVIDIAEDILTEEIIKQLHYILKHD